MNKKLLILSATPRTNYKLATQISDEAALLGLESKIIDLESLNLPLYSPDREDEGVPENAIMLTREMVEHRAFVLLAPEYNGGLPPVVVNGISWISRATDNWREGFQMKPCMIGSVSGGGGTKVIQVMTIQLQHLGAIVLPRPVLVTSQKAFDPKSVQTNLKWLKDYLG